MKLKLKPKHLQGVPAKPAKKIPASNSKYREEFCTSIRQYFADPESWDIHYTDKGAGQCLPKGKLPTFERFGASIGVSTETMLKWCREYPEFGEAYADAKALQKAFIMEAGGITLNAGFATFLLKCCHDMREPETKQSTDIGEALAKLVGNMPS